MISNYCYGVNLLEIILNKDNKLRSMEVSFIRWPYTLQRKLYEKNNTLRVILIYKYEAVSKTPEIL